MNEKLLGTFHDSIRPSLEDLASHQDVQTIRGMELGGPKAFDPRNLGHNAENYEEGFLTVYSYTRKASQRVLIEVGSSAVEQVRKTISEINNRYFGEQIRLEMERYKHHFSSES